MIYNEIIKDSNLMEVSHSVILPVQSSNDSDQKDIIWNETSQAVSLTNDNAVYKEIVYSVPLQLRQIKPF